MRHKVVTGILYPEGPPFYSPIHTVLELDELTVKSTRASNNLVCRNGGEQKGGKILYTDS